jgi:hypothetical protein
MASTYLTTVVFYWLSSTTTLIIFFLLFFLVRIRQQIKMADDNVNTSIAELHNIKSYLVKLKLIK